MLLSSLNTIGEEFLNTGETIFDTIIVFLTTKIWPFISAYRFLIFAVFVILLMCIIVIWAIRHVPSRGRIVDIYDATGEKQDKKTKKKRDMEIHDLPEEFYKRRK